MAGRTTGFASAIGDIRGELAALSNETGASSEVFKKFAGLQDKVTDAFSNLGKSVNVFNRDVMTNIRSLRQSNMEFEKLSASVKNVEIRQKAAALLTQHWTRSLTDLGNAAKQASSFVVGGVDAISKTMRGATKEVGGLHGELLKFNRQSLETSRTADLLGRKLSLTPKFWEDLGKKTSLSKTQFLELQNGMMKLSETTVPLGKDMLDVTAVLTQKFGPAMDVVEDRMQRLVQMENKLPGVRDELMKMAAAGKDFSRSEGMGDLTLLMKDLGTSMRDLDVMNQITKPMNQAQKSMMSFEKAVAERDEAIQNLNVNTALTAQESMIKVEKAMTIITVQIDKILQKFTLLPKAFVYIKQIAVASFGGMVAGVLSLIRYVQTLTASFTQAAAASAGIRIPAAPGMGGRMLGGIGATAGLLGAGMQAYQAYGEMKGAGPNAGIEEKYLAEAKKSRGGGRMIGAGVGAVLGGAVGTIIPGAGTIAGAGLGAWAGGAIGGMVGGKMGKSEDEMRGYAKIAMALDQRGLKVERIIKSEQDVLAVINEQADAVDKTRAIRALIEDGLMDEAKLTDLAVKNGQKEITQLIGGKKEHDKILADQKGANATAMAKVRALNSQLTLLKVIQQTFGQISKHSSSIGNTMVETWSKGFASKQFETASVYSGQVLKKLTESSRMVESMYETQLKMNTFKSASGGASTFLTDKGVGQDKVKIISAAYDDVLRAKQAAAEIPITKEAEKRAAEENYKKIKETYEKRLDELGIDEKIKAELKKITDFSEKELSNIAASAPILAKMAVDEQRIAEARNLVAMKMKSRTAGHEAELGLMDAQLRVQRAQANVAEKSAAGYAVSYAYQKQIYDNLVGQRRETQGMLQDLERGAPASIWQDHSAALQEAGVKMSDLNNLTKNRDAIVNKINAASQKGGANIQGLQVAEITVNEELKKQLETREKILGLQGQELDMAMHLREGYLDVINEMTTGKDMMSQLLPDANRGIMALQELSMRVKGDTFGGAMKRGFVSFSPFAEAEDLSKAPRFTPGGFVPPSRSAVVEKYQQHLERTLDASARLSGGGGQFAGQKSLDASSAYAIGAGKVMDTAKTNAHTASITANGETTVNANNLIIKNMGRAGNLPGQPSPAGGAGVTNTGPGLAGGGRIPGIPSSRDNMIGMIDGRQPIGLASGEFVVNAKAASRHRRLLEGINSQGGVSSSGLGLEGGGDVDAVSDLLKNRRAYYTRIPLEELVKKAALNDDLAMDVLASRTGEPNNSMTLFSRLPEDQLLKLARRDSVALRALAVRLKKKQGKELSYNDAMKQAQYMSRSSMDNFGRALMYGAGKAAGKAGDNSLSIIGDSSEAAAKGTAHIIEKSSKFIGMISDLSSAAPISQSDEARHAKMLAKYEREDAIFKENRGNDLKTVAMIRREAKIRPGLREYVSRKMGGRKSISTMIGAYHEFMDESGNRQDARIADEKTVMRFVRSNEERRRQLHLAYEDRTAAGLSPKEAKRASLLAVSSGIEYAGWKSAHDSAEKFWAKEEVANKPDVKGGPKIMGMTMDKYLKWKRESQKRQNITVYSGKEKVISGLAGGGSVGLSTLAAMMSGTVSIGSLNVNGQALARNLSGANDMSIAMERARQNHSI